MTAEVKPSGIGTMIAILLDEDEPEIMFNRLRSQRAPAIFETTGEIRRDNRRIFEILAEKVARQRGIDVDDAIRAMTEAVGSDVDLDVVLDYPWPRDRSAPLDDDVDNFGTF